MIFFMHRVVRWGVMLCCYCQATTVILVRSNVQSNTGDRGIHIPHQQQPPPTTHPIITFLDKHMEDYKDVMLSEPPSRFNNGAGGGGGPAIQAVSLENYKGILLCDRPSNLRAINTGAGLVKAQGDGGLAPFLPSGKAEDRHLGFQPTQEERAKLELQRNIRKDNPYGSKGGSNPALTKHRRWLRSFAHAVKSVKLNEAEKQLDLQAKLQRIREQQAEARKQQTSQRSQEPAAASSSDAADGVVNVQEPQRVLPPKKKAAGKSKPKWAMTEDEALDAELDDCAGLIQFAQNLNYDQFIQDYEVKEALAIMRDRVKELAASKKIDLTSVERDADAEVDQEDQDFDRLSECPSTATTTARETFLEAAKQRRDDRRKAKEAADAAAAAAASAGGQVVHEKGWNSATQAGDVLRNAIQADSLALADKILANSSSMNKIHTRFSLARLLQNCALAGRDPTQELSKNSQQASAFMNIGEPLVPPKETRVSAEATGLQSGEAPQRRILTDLRKAKDKAQNLPYMYRCPSL